MPVRLQGVAAPELDEPGGLLADAYARGHCAGCWARLVEVYALPDYCAP